MKLFEPISIGELTLKNRLVFPPLETNYATDKGCVTQRLLDHYENIAKGGVGLIVVQATNVNPDPALTVTRFVLGIYMRIDRYLSYKRWSRLSMKEDL
jgi:2,4-dienoyl-CoA reductase-like NADH-dependent reductase (Old Yellow Enzyme family)